MIPAQHAIARLRRDLAVSLVLQGVLAAAAAVCVVVSSLPAQPGFSGSIALALVGGIWLVLSYRSVRGSRMAANSPALIAAGDFEQAERQIEEALRSFSLFRTVKLRSMHSLAMLRHAQRQWPETALLCQALLRERLGAVKGLSRSTRLILADAMLEVGDVRGAHNALAGLYRERLALGEALELMVLQLDYLARIGEWEQMLSSAGRKVDLAELLPGERSARAQAFLALAARRTGRMELARWLTRRVELLADVNEVVSQRPFLSELWAVGGSLSEDLKVSDAE